MSGENENGNKSANVADTALVVMMKRTNPSRAVRKGVKTMAEAVRTPPTAKRSPIVPFDIRNWCLSMIGRNGMIRP